MDRLVASCCDLDGEAYRLSSFAPAFPVHAHDHYVIGRIAGGRRILSIPAGKIMLHPGDLLVLPPGMGHGCTAAGEEFLAYEDVNISKGSMESILGFLPSFRSSVIDDAGLSSSFSSLVSSILYSGRDVRWESLAAFLSSLPAAGKADSDDQAIEEAVLYISDRCCEPISVQDMASAAGLALSTFMRRFRRSRGISPYRYLESVRIGKAEDLIRGGMGIAEAAAATGWTDQSHFTRFFSSFTGLTPARYRSMFTGRNQDG